jgi:hypothetical protein
MENTDKQTSQKHFCHLLNEQIIFKVCHEIKILHTGFFYEKTLEEIKLKTGKSEEEIIYACKSCPHF